MKVFIANFGRENYLWPKCLEQSTLATFEDEDLWPFWTSGNKEGYIARCVTTKKTAAGITPTRPVASRWFNLARILTSSQGDLWIHREKDQLWWTVSGFSQTQITIEPAYKPDRPGNKVYIFNKPTSPWSNKNKKGNRLEWRSIHRKAREFLFTEGTLQQLGDDNAAYAHALINGDDLSPWHSRKNWKDKSEKSGNPVAISNAKERAAHRMAATAQSTVSSSNGQQVLKTVKSKELNFPTFEEFRAYIAALIDSQEGLCAITGIELQFDGEYEDSELLCSLDRIDSNGHYESGNLQIVCRFVNRWKGDGVDADFRRLIKLVRDSKGFE